MGGIYISHLYTAYWGAILFITTLLAVSAKGPIRVTIVEIKNETKIVLNHPCHISVYKYISWLFNVSYKLQDRVWCLKWNIFLITALQLPAPNISMAFPGFRIYLKGQILYIQKCNFVSWQKQRGKCKQNFAQYFVGTRWTVQTGWPTTTEQRIPICWEVVNFCFAF